MNYQLLPVREPSSDVAFNWDGARRCTHVYHHHLKKCGGTTLNRWLDLQILDSRTWHRQPPTADPVALEDRASRAHDAGVAAFHHADIVHSHIAIGAYAPAGTFRFTVLRNPAERLVSQIADWRRLTDIHFVKTSADMRTCLTEVSQMRLAPFLARHARAGLQDFLDNYMVRAIAETTLGPFSCLGVPAADLVDTAHSALDSSYDLVGLTERAAETRLALGRRLGWAPAPYVPRANATGSAVQLADEAAEAADLLAELTMHDTALYEHARNRFADEIMDYDAAMFEAEHASRRMRALQGELMDGRIVYSVRGPLVGHGWHGRDGAGTPACAVWTGPERHATLYIPTPAGQAVSLHLWVRGYAAAAQRDALQMWVDGQPAQHRFDAEDGYADMVTIDANTTRDFVRLQIDTGTTFTDEDSRPRGLAFDRFGWSLR